MKKIIFKRKIYAKMLEWKNTYKGSYALLIEGARRTGKSTVAKDFAKNEYKSFILIDFANVSPEINALFNDTSNLDYFFLQLQQLTRTQLYERESVIIFDEVQLQPLARQAIKYLVADGRYDFIETGSLISIRKNTKNILIPSEEHRIQLYPLDFEEFLEATGDTFTWKIITEAFKNKTPLSDAVHRQIMRTFRLYMAVGGMPQAILSYLNTNNLGEVDKIKREIISLYIDDFRKIDESGFAGNIFKSIPSELARNASRYSISNVEKTGRSRNIVSLLADMADSFTVNIASHADDPNVGLMMNSNPEFFKLFALDTGIFISLAFSDKDFTENTIYDRLLSDKLSVNMGYVYENIVAQQLVCNGNNLFYYTMQSDTSHHLYEIDFLISKANKLCPIEVKSSNYRNHNSLDFFIKKFSSRIEQKYVIHTKNLKYENGITYLPVYMTACLG